jgi:hypothetical protein
VAVQGEARKDADFTAAGDRVRFRVDLGAATGPLQIDAELLYQPITYRWAHNLAKVNAPELPEGGDGKGFMFHPAPAPTQADVEAIVERASKRILRFLQRRGVISLVTAPGDGEVTVVTDETLGDKGRPGALRGRDRNRAAAVRQGSPSLKKAASKELWSSKTAFSSPSLDPNFQVATLLKIGVSICEAQVPSSAFYRQR